ncbi:hypothetical protein [Crocosphaera chwakensis]|uniref:Uncharacterized protein n=1 Tax=Crocosphaera chwakensis CCY0110 TaxID=391612 RepID=A3IVJ1_9CHRO|nr:hypothetical protein [Crocosphaera chwakensis]EAZ89466.1 hypothetical protein CY0110_01445 [Crocosphaera chwakensis CCY0110]
MTTVAEIQEQIEKIRASGDIAPPNTWIGSSSLKKKDKKHTYTYYRLLKADYDNRTKSGKPKTKMVSYLGSADNEKYLNMKAAIERRNQIEKLLKQLEKLEKETNTVTQTSKRKPRQPALTTLVMELITQVQTLQNDIQELKQQLSTSKK